MPRIAGRLAVETKRNQRLLGALVKAGTRIDQPVAVKRDAVLDRICGSGLGIGQQRNTRRQAVAGIDIRNHVKGHLCGAAEQLPQPRRILQPGQLDEHAVASDALDGRLRHANLIDALAHDFKALLERTVHPVAQTGFSQLDADLVLRCGDLNVGCAPTDGADGSGQSLQDFEGAGAPCVVGNVDQHRISDNPDRLRLNSLLDQFRPGFIEQRVKAVGLQCRRVDFEH